MKTYYLGLEPIASRYTLQLTEWNRRVFEARNIPFIPVTGDMPQDLAGKIVNGTVLDAHGRTYFSLTQVAKLVKLMQEGKVTAQDVVFLEDMFTPGIESLAYIMDQTPRRYRPRVYVRCLAQTIDPDDFVNREGMFPWMRHFELMLDNFVSGILVASEEMVAHLRIAGFKAPIYVTGLPFGKQEVLERVPARKPLAERKRRVCFAARWDQEKQPQFYIDVAREVFKEMPDVEFCVLSGRDPLPSNRQEFIDLAKVAVADPTLNFKVYTGLKKNDYYEILADSQLLFNCALQDWVSNTVSEADTLGTMTLYPAYRSFPEVFANDRTHMYIPWSVMDARDMIIHLLTTFSQDIGLASDWQDGTISRTIDVFLGDERYGRHRKDYRKHVAAPKYAIDAI